MSTFLELTEVTESQDDDGLLLRNASLGEDSRITKENLLKEVTTYLENLDTSLQTTDGKVEQLSQFNIMTTGNSPTERVLNVFIDSDTYTLPLLVNFPDNEVLALHLPESYRSENPIVACASGNVITYSNGSDTTLGFDRESWGTILLYKENASAWRI